MASNAIQVPFVIAGGWVSDIVGRKWPLVAALLVSMVGVALFFTLAKTVDVVILTLIVSLALCPTAMVNGIQAALFAEQFPTQYRFAGSSISITLMNVVFSGPAPFLAAAMVAAGGVQLVMWVVIAVLLLSALAMVAMRDNFDIDLTKFVTTEPAERVPSMFNRPNLSPRRNE